MPEAPQDEVQKSKIAQALLFGSSVVFGLALIGIYFVVPVWRQMFAEFGSKLPWVTDFVLEGRILFPLVGWLSMAGSYAVVYRKTAGPKWVLAGVAITLFEMGVFLGVVTALFLPVFYLGQVTAE